MPTKEILISPRIQICYDKVFKKVFRDNPNALAKLISDITGIPYLEIKDNIIFSSNGLRLNHIKEKSKVCDFIVNVDNYSINIEMNMYPSKWIKYRNFAYLNNLYNGIVESGLKYNEYGKKVAIQINFNVNYKREDLPISKCVVFDTNRCKIFIDNYYIYQIDIVKCLDIVYNESEITNVLPGIRWGALLYADNLDDIETILGNDLLEKKEKEEFMKTVKGIVYEGKAPFMTWDIEKDIENQIASTKAEFIEEHGEEIKAEIKAKLKAEYLDENKDKIKEEYLDANKDKIKEEYIDVNKDKIKEEYIDVNKDKIKEEYIDVNKDKIEKEYLNQLSLETIKQRDIIFIKNMLKENLPLEFIAKISNKSLEEIENIIKENKN